MKCKKYAEIESGHCKCKEGYKYNENNDSCERKSLFISAIIATELCNKQQKLCKLCKTNNLCMKCKKFAVTTKIVWKNKILGKLVRTIVKIFI